MQESLLPLQSLARIRGTHHAGQVQTWIYGSATTRVTLAFKSWRQRNGVRAVLQANLAVRSPEAARIANIKSRRRAVGRATKWGGQKNEEIRKGLWLVKIFSAFPASPACFTFRKLQFPSLAQPSCTNWETLTAGGSRLHLIRQLKSNRCIFVLLPSHTWLSPALMLLRGTQRTEVIY